VKKVDFRKLCLPAVFIALLLNSLTAFSASGSHQGRISDFYVGDLEGVLDDANNTGTFAGWVEAQVLVITDDDGSWGGSCYLEPVGFDFPLFLLRNADEPEFYEALQSSLTFARVNHSDVVIHYTEGDIDSGNPDPYGNVCFIDSIELL